MEVGAVAFEPVITSRMIATVAADDDSKLERWGRIVREAAEQSGRGIVPPVGPPLAFAAACELAAARGPAAIAWEGKRERPLSAFLRAHAAARDLGRFIGPEGGFTPDEIAPAREAGVEPATLGPWSLRAETAAVVGTALALAELIAPETAATY